MKPIAAASVLLVLSLLGCFGGAAEKGASAPLDVTVTAMDARPVNLSSYRGKALLIVNVASECGYTPQYEDLQALHARYAERGFTVLGFPSNDYGGQEPGDDAAILQFAQRDYGVTFPLFAKVHTQGPEIAPLYRALTASKGDVKWNFTKFLVDPQGRVVAKFDSAVEPLSPELVAAVEAVLPTKG